MPENMVLSSNAIFQKLVLKTINKNIQKIVVFVKVTSRLFDTLSKLEFIGKRRESGIFVKEESVQQAENQPKARRRFLG